MSELNRRSWCYQLRGGPFDGKWVQSFEFEPEFVVEGHKYRRNEDRTATYIPPEQPPEPESVAPVDRVAFGESDLLVVTYPGRMSIEQAMAARSAIAARLGVEESRCVIMDMGARISVLTRTAPLSQDKIDAMAQREGLTALQAPEWFTGMVRAVEAEHLIK